jgi:hypothetical protein
MNYSQEWCIENMHSEDWDARVNVAKHIESSHLIKMINDKDWQIRSVVARRIDKKNALLMSVFDEDEYIRELAWKNVMR